VKSPCAKSFRCRRGSRIGWVLAGLLVCCAGGCDLPGRPKPADRWVAPSSELSFGVLFRRNCAGCHGSDGKLGPAPPLNDKLFLALVPDDELKRVVAEGRPGTLMPAFSAANGGQLTAVQVRVLADGIKARWGPVQAVPADTPAYRLETAARPDRTGSPEAGLAVFGRACASCHGEIYGGDPQGEPVGPINAPEFLDLWSDQALRRLVITGRPDLGMPACTDQSGRPEGFTPLTSHEVSELVALLASWREGGITNARGD
jgi:cytochrome c oxidase cbb3-type subunit III